MCTCFSVPARMTIVLVKLSLFPEVQQQPWSVAQFHEQVLAVTPRGLELPALEPTLQPIGGHAAEDLYVHHLDHLDILVQARGVNVSSEDLQLGKLGHDDPSLRYLAATSMPSTTWTTAPLSTTISRISELSIVRGELPTDISGPRAG